MKPLALALISCMAALACADRLVSIPTGTKVFSNHFKLEGIDWSDDHSRQASLTYGLNASVEVGVSWFRPSGEDGKFTFDGAYNVVAPIIDTSPGISVGFLDGGNVTPQGRAVYLAATYRIGNDGEHNQEEPTELDFGFWSRKTGLMFVGVALPFSGSFRLVAEHDSNSLTAGAEFRPVDPLVIKVLARDGRPALGLTWSQRL